MKHPKEKGRPPQRTGSRPKISGHQSGENYSTLAEAITAAGMTAPDHIEPGRFHRFPGAEKPPSNRAGWCRMFEDGEGAVFGDFSTGLSETWQARQPVDESERRRWKAQTAKARKEAEQQRKQSQAKAAHTAQEIWDKAGPADELHGYLLSKNIGSHGIRQTGNNLLIPLRDADGKIRSLQSINGKGDKLFHAGGEVKGNCFTIGEPGDVMVIAEGFATAASIHEATRHPVVVAFNAGNLKAVAETIRSKYPNARIIVAADNDEGTKANPGVTAATEAAQAFNGMLAVPGQPGDFNDLMIDEGPDAVRAQIEAATTTATATRMTRPLSEIEPERIRWLWPNRIARGKVTLVAGDPKLGKSLLTADITARITSGKAWPVDGTKPPQGSVIFASAEDDAADTIRPRLEAAGADVRRVHILETVIEADPDTLEIRERMFNLKRDIQRLDRELASLGDVVAVVIDPITAYLGGTDSHKNSDMRELLAPLAKLAGKHGVAVIAVSHLNKGNGTSALYRVSGSLAFTATARAVWLVAKDQEDDERRLLLPSGSNIAPDIGGLAYRITTAETRVGAVAIIDWEPDPIDIDATEALKPDNEERTERDEATDWLRDLLYHGRMTASDVQKAAKAAGMAWRTVQRARKAAGVETKREGFGKGAVYWWDMRAMDTPCTKAGIHDERGAHAVVIGPMDDTKHHARHARHGTDTGKHGEHGEQQ